jgi:cytochrome c nitrite reductase small subunit
MKLFQGVRLPGLIVCAMLGATLGSGSYTAYYAEGFSYLSNDPRHCANCHIMRDQFDSWQKASHHAVATCNDCHVPNHSFLAKYLSKAENGFWHSKGFTLQDFHEPIRIRPKNSTALEDNCMRCHGDLVSEITACHSLDSGDVSCVRCHAQVGHGPVR